MNQLGMGVMIRKLFDTPEAKNPNDYLDHKIVAANFQDDQLDLSFDNNKKIRISDAGQSCCEHRYMRTDDDINSLVGKTLKGVNVKDAPDVDDNGECHEICFLEIQTDDGCITFSNHNEHNGYYGGFALGIQEIE